MNVVFDCVVLIVFWGGVVPFFFFFFCLRPTNSRTVVKGCDTLIIGGTTAGVAAALAAVDAGGTNVCLLTNTDEVGGQLVQEGVPSIDFAWKSVRQLNVSQFSHDPSNLPSLFSNLLNTSESPGKCWVSVDCPELEALREGLQNLLLERSQHLRVFYNTVLSSIKSRGGGKGKGKIIDEVLAIQRTPSSSLKFCDGWDVPLSAQVEDWYSLVPSERYPKKDLLSFTPNVVVEATDWGEVLFLSRAPHLLGAQERLQWAKKGDKIEKHLFGGDVCGQATTVTFVEEMKEFSAPEPIYSTDVPTEVSSHYSLQNFPWQKVWTYRREFTLDPGMGDNVRTGDRTLQNWGGGNDNVFGYAFLPVGEEDVGTVSDGPHGLNLTVFEIGEQAAFGWHEYYRAQAPSPYTNRTFLVTSPQRDTRTCTGLSKVPYFRDSRRSVGMDGYVWPILDVTTSLDGMTSLPPFDRMGVGLYNVDFHLLQGCAYPKDVYRDYEVFPFFLPLRAFTNMKYQNLLVTGLNLAQVCSQKKRETEKKKKKKKKKI